MFQNDLKPSPFRKEALAAINERESELNIEAESRVWGQCGFWLMQVALCIVFLVGFLGKVETVSKNPYENTDLRGEAGSEIIEIAEGEDGVVLSKGTHIRLIAKSGDEIQEKDVEVTEVLDYRQVREINRSYAWNPGTSIFVRVRTGLTDGRIPDRGIAYLRMRKNIFSALIR